MDRKSSRYARFLTAGTAVGAAGLLVFTGDAVAGPKAAKKKAAVVRRAETPLGLQGARGAGVNVVIPFTLVDATRVKSNVEVEYGLDLNGDGSITTDEYRKATEDRLDARNTRRNRKPQLYVTAGDIGANHAFVWKSDADVQSGRYETLLYQYDDQGRLIPDPQNPDSWLFDDAQAGVRIRLRAVRGSGASKLVGDWVVTDALSLNNNSTPQMTISDPIPNASGTASDEIVLIPWVGIDVDSEDANDNGNFDAGEDRNGNGVFDQEQMGVAFDFYRLQLGDEAKLPSMTTDELAALLWQPCTRAAGVGDTDSFRATSDADGRRVYGSPNGRSWTFAWDSITDVGTVRDKFIIRARPIDVKKENGDFAYHPTPFVLDNTKVFTSAANKQPAIALSSARTGCTVTNLVYGLERSDATYGKPFQQVIVAGGQPTATGAATAKVDVFRVSSETADTVSASINGNAPQLANPRSHHTGTALADGRVLFAGGFDASGNPTATTEIFDPATFKIYAGPPLATARARHTAVLLSTGDVAIIGGVGAGGTLLSSIELYHVTAFGELTVASETLAVTLVAPQHSARAVLLPDQTVLIASGISGAPNESGTPVLQAQILDVLANPTDPPGTLAGGELRIKHPTLTTLPGTPVQARKLPGATALIDGNVLFSGGASGGTALSSMELFDWHTRTFVAIAEPMAQARSGHVASLLGNGEVLLAGGATDDNANPATTGKAEIVRIEPVTATTWRAAFQPVNGDMSFARRSAAATSLMNGRVFIAGGTNGAGETSSKAEVYTPDTPNNTAPKAFVFLPSEDLSHKYGATLYYRLVDAEADRARVQVQFRVPLALTWKACTAQSSTIGGDVAEETANLITDPRVTLDHAALPIDPVAKNTQGDHSFIWAMSADLVSPLPGQTVTGFNLRVVPFGAVRGVADVSQPVTILANTKPVAYIAPLEDEGLAGTFPHTPNPKQGGDIELWAHIQDIDGEGTAANRNGDPVDVYFEWALDKNGDGQIVAPDESFVRMTPAGEAILGTQPNPILGATSWSQSFQDPSANPGTRSAATGWTRFKWDALFDLGLPPSQLNFEMRNVWIRVTATDNDAGFPKVLRNKAGDPTEQFVYIRDAQGFYLESFAPIESTKTTVKVNEPIVFTFNKNVEPTSATPNTIKIFRRISPTAVAAVKGVFVTKKDQPVVGKSQVIFYPWTQESNAGSPVYGPNDASTILFPFLQYSFVIPAYQRQDSPFDDVPPMVRPLLVGGESSTFQYVNSGFIDGEADPNYRFTTTTGVYDDKQAVKPSTTVSPVPAYGSTLPGPTTTSQFAIAFDHSIEYTTAKAPNLTVRGNNGQNYVVPGKWSVANTVLADGKTQGVLTFIPLLSLPSGDQIIVNSTSGLLGTNGQPLSVALSGATYIVNAYGTKSVTTVEGFSNQNQRDSAVNTASWGDDQCFLGVLTGLQDGSTPPQGGSNLTVNNGQTVTLTAATSDYQDIIVNKGGRLVLQASTPMLLRAKGKVLIDGTLSFAGADGGSGIHGNTGNTYIMYGPNYAPYNVGNGKRLGGVGYNGGGNGGNSAYTTTPSAQYLGDNGIAGVGSSGSGGQGGYGINTTYYSFNTSTFYYGMGGGSGGGHGTAGLQGGWCSSYPGSLVGLRSTVGAKSALASDFSAGVTAGGGGGGGASSSYSYYYHSGGAGGAGAGHVTIICNSTFTLSAAGYIDGQGGEGGSNAHYGGAGGGGAGAGLWIKAGGNATIDGIIDLRGGRGGPSQFGYYGDTWVYYNTTTFGSNRFGGDGGLGRLTIEAPNFAPSLVDSVRVIGAMTVRQVSSLPTTTLAYGAPPSELTGTGTGTFTKDFGGGTSDYAYTSIDVPYNRTVKLLNGSTSSHRAIRLFVRDTVKIGGLIDVSGQGTSTITTTYYPNAAQSIDMNQSDTRPYTSAVAVQTATALNYSSSYVSYSTGYYGGAGGGTGGAGMGNSGSSPPTGSYYHEGYDGNGPTNGVTGAPGKHKYKLGHGYGSYYWSTGDVGGSGAGAASPGERGWASYCGSTQHNGTGSFTDTTGNGVTAAQSRVDCTVGGSVVDATSYTGSTFANFAGSGGGGGNGGGYTVTSYWPFASTAGGGGGALAIICLGSVDIQSGSLIAARGGEGNPPGGAYLPYYSRSGAGGGSGGTVYIAGKDVTIAKVQTGEGGTQTTSGATVDLQGGAGGGWRQPFTGIRNEYPWYNTHGNFGGDGGYGRLVVEYTNSLNGVTTPGGKTLANRWGYEQTVFTDARKQYRTFAGAASFKCRAIPGNNTYQSTFIDLGSLRPKVTTSTYTVGTNTSYTLNLQGAQSHPFNAGTGGTGEADPANVSGLVNVPSSGTALSFDGWRFVRFSGTIARLTSTGQQPTLDNIAITATTDSTAVVGTNP